jgi:hypothetical protein
MAAAALPIALVLGLVAEVVFGLVRWALGGDRVWWRGVTGIGTEVLRLVRDREGSERATVVQASGATAALFGAGMAAAGALGIGPDDLPLLYLALVVASAGGMVLILARTVEPWTRARPWSAVLAEGAFAAGLGAMFVRYGTLELEAVRGTQQVLGTGISLSPGLAAAGLVAAALGFSIAVASMLAPVPSFDRRRGARPGSAGSALLTRLCRWSFSGAGALVAGVLLAGGALEPFSPEGALSLGLGALAVAVVIGAAEALHARLTGAWRLAVPGAALLLGAAGATMVVLA